MRRVSRDFGQWLAGFTDGEGCFAISRSGRGTYRCIFRIALRADDAEIVDQIHVGLGIGSVRPTPAGTLGEPQTTWTVFSKPDCLALVRFFERYPLRSKKARDFAIWKQAVELWQHYGKGQRYADWAPMARLAAELVETRAFETNGKAREPIKVLPPPNVVVERDKAIAALWLEGKTSYQIARAIGISQDNVHRRIWIMREAGEQLPHRQRPANPTENEIRAARARAALTTTAKEPGSSIRSYAHLIVDEASGSAEAEILKARAAVRELREAV